MAAVPIISAGVGIVGTIAGISQQNAAASRQNAAIATQQQASLEAEKIRVANINLQKEFLLQSYQLGIS